MKISFTQFAIDKHWNTETPGTTITNVTPEQFIEDIHSCNVVGRMELGYAVFCRILFVPNYVSEEGKTVQCFSDLSPKNWTDAKIGSVPITDENRHLIQSGYEARNENELPVLTRWIEMKVPTADYLALILYDKNQLDEEGTVIDGDYGIVAILGQSHDDEVPMEPSTMTRNALGIGHGGSGVSISKTKYEASVDFWSSNVIVREAK